MEKDLVNIYTGLFKSLERECATDALPDILTSLRQSKQNQRQMLTPDIKRWQQRFGVSCSPTDISQAVSRPLDTVLGVLRLFCGGDETLAIPAICGALPRCSDCALTRFCNHYNRPRSLQLTQHQPAERLLSNGEDSLSDTELVSLLLFANTANGKEQLAQDLIAHYGDLRSLFNASGSEYGSLRGTNKSHALRLAAAGALHRRLRSFPAKARMRITSSMEIYNAYAFELREHPNNTAVLLLLDANNHRIRDAWFIPEPKSSTLPSLNELLRPAVRESAPCIAVAVLHTSESPLETQNTSSIPTTTHSDYCRRLRASCDILEMRLVDFLVVTPINYYSFSENDRLSI